MVEIKMYDKYGFLISRDLIMHDKVMSINQRKKNLNSGMYIIHINIEGETFVEKLQIDDIAN